MSCIQISACAQVLCNLTIAGALVLASAKLSNCELKHCIM